MNNSINRRFSASKSKIKLRLAESNAPKIQATTSPIVSPDSTSMQTESEFLNLLIAGTRSFTLTLLSLMRNKVIRDDYAYTIKSALGFNGGELNLTDLRQVLPDGKAFAMARDKLVKEGTISIDYTKPKVKLKQVKKQ